MYGSTTMLNWRIVRRSVFTALAAFKTEGFVVLSNIAAPHFKKEERGVAMPPYCIPLREFHEPPLRPPTADIRRARKDGVRLSSLAKALGNGCRNFDVGQN